MKSPGESDARVGGRELYVPYLAWSKVEPEIVHRLGGPKTPEPGLTARALELAITLVRG